jgi:hypothetical protein
VITIWRVGISPYSSSIPDHAAVLVSDTGRDRRPSEIASSAPTIRSTSRSTFHLQSLVQDLTVQVPSSRSVEPPPDRTTRTVTGSHPVTQLEEGHLGEKDHGLTHVKSIRPYRPGATIMAEIEENDVTEEVEGVVGVDRHQAGTIDTLILGNEAGLLRPDEEVMELVDPRRRIKQSNSVTALRKHGKRAPWRSHLTSGSSLYHLLDYYYEMVYPVSRFVSSPRLSRISPAIFGQDGSLLLFLLFRYHLDDLDRRSRYPFIRLDR